MLFCEAPFLSFFDRFYMEPAATDLSTELLSSRVERTVVSPVGSVRNEFGRLQDVRSGRSTPVISI